MKQLINRYNSIFLLLLLGGCASNTKVSPSNNSALNSVSPIVKKEKAGFIQKTLDEFVEDEWTPTVSKDEKIQKKYMSQSKKASDEEVIYIEKEDKNFTLQEIVDKSEAYFRAKPADHNNSHVKKLNNMPVIGKVSK
ncbi:hypothetical protein GJV85_11150 [Sulfurimonas aquatica]|uniref:Uncharacterized protein n=1 Tax=Sulfurimonas aquatica TaxID=2672570 RepID=A0A975B1R0_9BACT|nr:hypothetical protein [Sulfurimonas aquatica]QSZ42641.1 hypothetical protein GJV85_11150 [Sulfurimonas aquatica]